MTNLILKTALNLVGWNLGGDLLLPTASAEVVQTLGGCLVDLHVKH